MSYAVSKRLLLLAAIATAAALPPLLAEDAESSESTKAKNALLGCWESLSEKGYLIRFEPARVVASMEGHLQLYKARYDGGKVFVQMGGQEGTLDTSVTGGELVVKGREGDQRFKRLEQVPEDLEVRALKLGEAVKLEPGRVKKIQDELAARLQRDQAVRTDPTQRDKMGEVDGDNTEYLAKLVQEIGWIDAERFGAEAANAAFLIVQHSGHLKLMMAALPPIEKDVRAKKLDGQPYALLYDRLQLNLGEKQRFGSQVGSGANGELVVLPLEDRENVDVYRAEMNMIPLQMYLDFFKEQNGGKEIKFADDAE